MESVVINGMRTPGKQLMTVMFIYTGGDLLAEKMSALINDFTHGDTRVSYRFFLLSFFGFCRTAGVGPLAFFICSVVLPSLDSVSSCCENTGSSDHPLISPELRVSGSIRRVLAECGSGRSKCCSLEALDGITVKPFSLCCPPLHLPHVSCTVSERANQSSATAERRHASLQDKMTTHCRGVISASDDGA